MEPTLYLIMRSDIQDGNPGKMMVQAAHAQAEVDAYMEEKLSSNKTGFGRLPGPSGLLDDYAKWRDGRAFGRTIVLSATEEIIKKIAMFEGPYSSTIDPSYPWENYYGELQLTQEITCGWAFVWGRTPQELLSLLSELDLHQ